MRINLVLEAAQRRKLSPLQQRVLEYVEEHPDEVFAYRDLQLSEAVGGKPSSIGFSLWALHRRGLIDKQSAVGKVYFGSHEAIESLRLGLGVGRDKGFDLAVENAERIRARVGNIDSQELLDELRAGRE